MGVNYKTYTDRENGKKLNHFYNNAYQKNKSFKGVEWEMLRKDGAKRFMESSVSLIKDENENITGFCGIVRDVTRRKQAEQELKMAQDHLMESSKMAALGELVAGVAHEINTPIGIGVTGMSTLDERTEQIIALYKADDLSQEDFERYLKTVSEASRAVLSNLHSAADLVRTFKQVAVDQSSEEKRTFPFQKYLHDILMSMQPRLKKTSHCITVNCPEDIELNSYPGVFSRIITNLLINSLDHGFEGIENGQIVFDISANQDYFILQYTDNGKGISPEALGKIFDPFFTTKRGKGGTGLGMHIVYNLVTQTLQGKIKCTSAPGQGTKFIITIPI
jgi:signal transduction histidine kinase